MSDVPAEARGALRPRKRSAQWARQFLVAAQLARRGYEVSFTMGNHTPVADLMVGHPVNGLQFWVDVKALWMPNAWWAHPKPERPNLYYVLVLVGIDRQQDRYFVLDQGEFNGLIDHYRVAHPNAKPVGGFNWGDALPFEDSWEKLPGWSAGPG